MTALQVPAALGANVQRRHHAHLQLENVKRKSQAQFYAAVGIWARDIGT